MYAVFFLRNPNWSNNTRINRKRKVETTWRRRSKKQHQNWIFEEDVDEDDTLHQQHAVTRTQIHTHNFHASSLPFDFVVIHQAHEMKTKGFFFGSVFTQNASENTYENKIKPMRVSVRVYLSDIGKCCSVHISLCLWHTNERI